MYEKRLFVESKIQNAPTLCQFGVTKQRISGAVTQIEHRAGVRSLYLRIVIHRVDPQIQQGVHLRAAALAEKLVGDRHRQEEKTGIFDAECVVIQHAVMLLPAQDFEFYQLPAEEKRIGNQVAFL